MSNTESYKVVTINEHVEYVEKWYTCYYGKIDLRKKALNKMFMAYGHDYSWSSDGSVVNDYWESDDKMDQKRREEWEEYKNRKLEYYGEYLITFKEIKEKNDFILKKLEEFEYQIEKINSTEYFPNFSYNPERDKPFGHKDAVSVRPLDRGSFIYHMPDNVQQDVLEAAIECLNNQLEVVDDEQEIKMVKELLVRFAPKLRKEKIANLSL